MNSDRVKVDNTALVKSDYMLGTLECLRSNSTSVARRESRQTISRKDREPNFGSRNPQRPYVGIALGDKIWSELYGDIESSNSLKCEIEINIFERNPLPGKFRPA